MKQISILHNVSIATARINGLNKSPYYFKQGEFYAVDITFTDSSTLLFDNMPYIKVGKTREEANNFWSKMKKNFSDAHILDKNRVAIICDKYFQIVAIGNTGEDVWIDVTDQFKAKSFAELNIEITSLKVY